MHLSSDTSSKLTGICVLWCAGSHPLPLGEQQDSFFLRISGILHHRNHCVWRLVFLLIFSQSEVGKCLGHCICTQKLLSPPAGD